MTTKKRPYTSAPETVHQVDDCQSAGKPFRCTFFLVRQDMQTWMIWSMKNTRNFAARVAVGTVKSDLRSKAQDETYPCLCNGEAPCLCPQILNCPQPGFFTRVTPTLGYGPPAQQILISHFIKKNSPLIDARMTNCSHLSMLTPCSEQQLSRVRRLKKQANHPQIFRTLRKFHSRTLYPRVRRLIIWITIQKR